MMRKSCRAQEGFTSVPYLRSPAGALLARSGSFPLQPETNPLHENHIEGQHAQGRFRRSGRSRGACHRHRSGARDGAGEQHSLRQGFRFQPFAGRVTSAGDSTRDGLAADWDDGFGKAGNDRESVCGRARNGGCSRRCSRDASYALFPRHSAARFSSKYRAARRNRPERDRGNGSAVSHRPCSSWR